MTFGERLKSFREAKRLTQEQLASEIGVAKTTVTGYERGNRKPDVEKIKKLASALGVSGDELLGTGHEKKPTPISESELSDPLDIQLMNLLQDRTPEEKKAWIALLEARVAETKLPKK